MWDTIGVRARLEVVVVRPLVLVDMVVGMAGMTIFCIYILWFCRLI